MSTKSDVNFMDSIVAFRSMHYAISDKFSDED